MKPSWRLKLDRADYHLIEVAEKVTTYADSQSYRAVKVRPAKGEQNVWRCVLEVTGQPDPMLAVVVGDVVHNARSALDHLVVSLVPRKYRFNASFPIRHVDPRRLNAAGDVADKDGLASFERAIRGLPPKAKALIERIQPYQADKPYFDALAVLSRLDNADKHRELTVIGRGLRDTLATVRIRGEVVLTQDGPGFRDDGTEVANFKLDGPQPPESEVEVEVSGAVCVSMEVGSAEEMVKAAGQTGVFALPSALNEVVAETRLIAVAVAAEAGSEGV